MFTPHLTALLVLASAASADAVGAQDAKVTIRNDTGGVAACYRFAAGGVTSERAIDTCTRAIAASADHPLNLTASTVNRGVIYYNAAEYARAVEDFSTAIDTYETRNPIVFVNRGLAYEGLRPGDPILEKRARADYEAALAISPDSATAKRRLKMLDRPFLERRDPPQRIIS